MAMGLLVLAALVACAAGTLSFWSVEAPQSYDFYEREGVVPAHRYSHGAVDDSVLNRMVVSLGYFYDHRNHRPTWLADTWALSYETKKWAMLHGGWQPAPSPRYGHSTVLYNREMLIFAGDSAPTSAEQEFSSRTQDLWSFDLDKHEWVCLGGQLGSAPAPAQWPAERSLQAAAVITSGPTEVMVIHGGLTKGDTWSYDLRSRTAWVEHKDALSPGVRHGAVAVGHGDAMYLHGGSTIMPVVLFDDLWRFTVAGGWARLADAPFRPSARSYHAAALLVAQRPAMVVFGGANCTGSCTCFNDVWTYDLRQGLWERVHTALAIDTRYHHTLVAHGGAVYTFGGESYSPRYMYHNSVASLGVQDDGLGLLVLAGVAGAGVVATLLVARTRWKSRKQKL